MGTDYNFIPQVGTLQFLIKQTLGLSVNKSLLFFEPMAYFFSDCVKLFEAWNKCILWLVSFHFSFYNVFMGANMARLKLRQDALSILIRSLDEVNAERLIRKSVSLSGDELRIKDKVINLVQVRRIVVVGCGKSTAAMALAAEDIFGNRLYGGIISVKYGHTLPLQKIQCCEAGHPIPDDAGIAATRRIVALLQELGENDLVLVLLSGGGSALLELPVGGLSLEDMRNTNRILLACGAEIDEINAVRKHLSQVKGGQLSGYAHPADVVTLAISDVIGDPPDAIASGPTVPNSTTFADVWKIVKKYSLECRLPTAVLEHLQCGIEGKVPETPKPGDSTFESSSYEIIGHNRMLLKAGRDAAEELGYQAVILTNRMRGEASHVGGELAALIRNIKSNSCEDKKAVCLLAGGETTVVLSGQGMGGRNQELALAAAIALDSVENGVLLAAGSDGTDGPTDAAGAIVDGTTVSRGREQKIDAIEFLRQHDSYHYLKHTEDLIKTGPTGTNVMDVVICLVK